MEHRKGIQVFLCTALLLAACQPAPEKEAITSRNDGAFDIAVAETSIKSNDCESDHQIVYDDLFTSTDQSVDFTFHINQELNTANMPVVQVEPHFLRRLLPQHVWHPGQSENAVLPAPPAYSQY